MNDDWQPLEAGGQGEGTDAQEPHEGVPRWLRGSLLDWVESVMTWSTDFGDYGWREDVLRQLERTIREPISGSSPQHMGATLMKMLASDEELCLRVVDFLLGFGGLSEETMINLEIILHKGGSAWTVGTRSAGRMGLVRRVDEMVQPAADVTMSGSGRPSEHLRAAWAALYGQQPDPKTAYDEAVRAVEAAAVPILAPKDPVPTLGKMAIHLRDASGKYRVRLPPTPEADPVALVRDMCLMLWKGQLWRHGTIDETIQTAPTGQEAETAVHLAACLVHVFTAGLVAPASA